MKLTTIFFSMAATCLLAACGKGQQPAKPVANMPISLSKPAKGDKAVYGLACMGCTDSVVVMLPNEGGDPVKYNIVEAGRNKQLFGNFEVGDWICILPNEKDKQKADRVINLDQLKATWTYRVMPRLRDVTNLSKRQQERILANMPDSVVEAYMIPREYGFTLKRMGQATSVGHLIQSDAVEDDSPVEYPEVPHYTEWHAYNGKLILVKGPRDEREAASNKQITKDTLTFVYMKDDSLALRTKKGDIIGFHKKKDAHSANAAAQAAADKQANKLKNELKK